MSNKKIKRAKGMVQTGILHSLPSLTNTVEHLSSVLFDNQGATLIKTADYNKIKKKKH